jgi:hypothetical protein
MSILKGQLSSKTSDTQNKNNRKEKGKSSMKKKEEKKDIRNNRMDGMLESNK